MILKRYKDFYKKCYQSRVHRLRLDRKITSYISVILTWIVSKTTIHPNHITILNFIVFFTGIIFMLLGKEHLWVGIFIVSIVCKIIDNIDGELARLKNLNTRNGMFLERLFHDISAKTFFFVLGVAVYIQTQRIESLFFGFILGMFSKNVVDPIVCQSVLDIKLKRYGSYKLNQEKDIIKKNAPRTLFFSFFNITRNIYKKFGAFLGPPIIFYIFFILAISENIFGYSFLYLGLFAFSIISVLSQLFSIVYALKTDQVKQTIFKINKK